MNFIKDCKIGENTVIREPVNLYKCEIGDNCRIGGFVYIEEGVKIGNNCKIKPFVFIPTGVTIEDDVFIGMGVKFTNDRYPRTYNKDWKLEKTIVRQGVSIGANTTILPGIEIGEYSIIGAGSVVTKNVPSRVVVVGNPAKIVKEVKI